MKYKTYTLAAMFILAFPLVAQANAGTPLMWATTLHMVFGNAIIGIIEGLLLGLIFRTSKWKAILILIAANYVSAWFGGAFIIGNLANQVSVNIENVQYWFWRFTFLAFLITLFVEFPFILFAIRKIKHALIKSIIATVLLHCISYSLLLGWYWGASGTSMMAELDVVSVAQMQVPEGYNLYYIAPDGNSILRADLTGKTLEKIKEVASPHRSDRLFARLRDEEIYDLFIHMDSDKRFQEKEELILKSFSSLAPVDRRIAEGHSKDPSGTWFNFGTVPKLATESDWEYSTGFWPVEGIRGGSKKEKSRFHFSLETPFVSWSVRNATHIKGDFVVFQLGDDQICILHPQAKQIALITRGKGPIVAEAKKPRLE